MEDERPGTEALEDDLLEAYDTPLLAQESDLIFIRLSIGERGRQIVLPLDRSIYVGRIDPATQVAPEVDLTQDDGPLFGVSRRHAKISRRGALVRIEDLGSLNGTYLNNRRLTPYLPEQLAHGDILELGRLVLQVLFEDEEELPAPPALSLQARKEYLEQRVAHLFELHEGGLCYLEWIAPESPASSRSITQLLGEILPLPYLGAALIGRYPDVSLQLASRRVSGHHCRVYYADYQFFIEDLGSTNGTFHNKIKLAPSTRQALQHGDTIRAGDVQLFFRNRLVAFLSELKSPLEQNLVIEAIETGAGQNPEAAIDMLARLLPTWLNSAEDIIIDTTLLLISNLLRKTPLRGVDLLLKTVKPGQKRLPDPVYRTLSQLMTGETETLLGSLKLVIEFSGDQSPALLRRVSQVTPPGPCRSFLEVCENLLAQGEYSQIDLQRLIGNLAYFSEEVKPENRLPLYQLLFEMLALKTLAGLAAFHLPRFIEEADTAPSGVTRWLQCLAGVAPLVQQALEAEEIRAEPGFLAQALTLLDQLKAETTPQKPELTLYSEILFRWRWIILNEQR